MKTKKMNSKLSRGIICLLFIVCSVMPSYLFSQGIGVNAGGAPADNSAMLDVSASNAGFLMPRVSLISNTDVVTIPSPAVSLMVYNTNASMTLGSGKGFYYWDGAQWRAVGGGAAPCSAAPAAPGAISGNIAVCTGGIGTYFVAPVTGATSYTWTFTGTGGTVSGTGNSVVISFSTSATSGNLTVTATNACGTSSNSPTLTVTVNGTPNSNFTSSTTTPSYGSSITLTPSATDNQLYFWTLPGPIYSTSPSAWGFTWNTVGIFNVTLTVTKNGCNSTSVVAIGTVLPAHSSQTFTYQGQVQAFTVPSGITSVTLDCFGGQGGNWSSYYGGQGGEAKGTLSVTPGQTLNIYVGASPSISGTWNGGGSGWQSGGGASDVRTMGGNWNDVASLNSRIIVGGGGGGVGYNSGSGSTGGAGGGLTGSAGANSSNAYGGSGGTQSSGGAGGSGPTGSGYAGSLGQGGNGYGNGSAGGSGYYGGGGGGWNNSGWYGGAGGGGSNYLSPTLTSITNSQGVNTGDGKVIITW